MAPSLNTSRGKRSATLNAEAMEGVGARPGTKLPVILGDFPSGSGRSRMYRRGVGNGTCSDSVAEYLRGTSMPLNESFSLRARLMGYID